MTLYHRFSERRPIMKRLLLLVIAFHIGTASWAFAQLYRYNPYAPYQPNNPASEPGRLPTYQEQERNSYNRDYGTNPFFTNPYDVVPRGPTRTDEDFYTNVFGKTPSRWYDRQFNYSGTYEKNVEEPRTLSDPYKEIRPYTSGELTSPYMGIIQEGPNKPTQYQSQGLTPPESKGGD